MNDQQCTTVVHRGYRALWPLARAPNNLSSRIINDPLLNKLPAPVIASIASLHQPIAQLLTPINTAIKIAFEEFTMNDTYSHKAHKNPLTQQNAAATFEVVINSFELLKVNLDSMIASTEAALNDNTAQDPQTLNRLHSQLHATRHYLAVLQDTTVTGVEQMKR